MPHDDGDQDKLAKLIALLGSNSDGERLRDGSAHDHARGLDRSPQ